MGAFDWFWKAMGSQSERNDKKSKAIVDEARSAAEKLAQSDDAAVAQAARDAVRGTQNDVNTLLSAAQSGREASEVSPLLCTSRRNIRSLERILLPVDNAVRGVRVLFSDPGVLADDLIRSLVGAEPEGRPLVVVSAMAGVTTRSSSAKAGRRWRAISPPSSVSPGPRAG